MSYIIDCLSVNADIRLLYLFLGVGLVVFVLSGLLLIYYAIKLILGKEQE